ncbi:hypothetical protein CHARACLAT_020517 [Characodon lateralis]|uniref:Uncharacterized protein n=1 Tax=Characodon lateralis TaxID=208331 RepID=A0ABU7DKF5_9TELE|nr:hypothetical protein [Characodon lateralis]
MIREQSTDFVSTTLLPELNSGFQGNWKCEAFFFFHIDSHSIKERELPKIDSSRDKPVASANRINHTKEGDAQTDVGLPQGLEIFAMFDPVLKKCCREVRLCC